jgi:hypothetical protein
MPAVLLSTALASVVRAQRQPGPYKPGPDSQVKKDVPREKVTHHEWRSTKNFPGTIREYWVYVPAQYDGKSPAAVMVFQDGEKDLDNAHGNWWLANLQMDKALAFAKYDYKFVPGVGGHNGAHGGAILPDSLRWLWRDHKAQKPR